MDGVVLQLDVLAARHAMRESDARRRTIHEPRPPDMSMPGNGRTIARIELRLKCHVESPPFAGGYVVAFGFVVQCGEIAIYQTRTPNRAGPGRGNASLGPHGMRRRIPRKSPYRELAAT